MRGQKLSAKDRGARRLTAHYHDFCRCVAVPVHEGVTLEEQSSMKKFEDAYVEAGDSSSIKKTLAGMRQELGTN